MRDLVTAATMLLEEVMFDHACTGVEWVKRLLPNGVVAKLQATYIMLINALPLDDTLAHNLARASHTISHLAKTPDDLIAILGARTTLSRWLHEDVMYNGAYDLQGVARHLLRLSEAVYPVAGATAWIRWTIEDATMQLQACLIRTLPGHAEWYDYFEVQRHLLGTFDSIAEGC